MSIEKSYLYRSFFFSSRRRHTRWPRDWSSDVCSSDLNRGYPSYATRSTQWYDADFANSGATEASQPVTSHETRSEERRVGKECRFRSASDHDKQKLRLTAGRAG